jgi:hypothetical protein
MEARNESAHNSKQTQKKWDAWFGSQNTQDVDTL